MIDVGNTKELERKAHNLKGAIGNLGGNIAYNMAYELELAAKGNRLDKAPDILKKLEDELERFKAFYQDTSWKKRFNVLN